MKKLTVAAGTHGYVKSLARLAEGSCHESFIETFFQTDISSLPVLSVDEFYEQRVAEGWWKPPPATTNALQVFLESAHPSFDAIFRRRRTERRTQSWRRG